MPTSPSSEFRDRRERVLKALNGAVALYLAGDAAQPAHGDWRADRSFAYLTGIENEAGASVLFDPQADDPKRRCILFLRPLNPELEAYDGRRDQISGALRARYGFDTVLRTTWLPRTLSTLARQRKRLACLHPFAVYDAPPSPDLALFRRVSERVPGVAIEDKSILLADMRSRKDKIELGRMQRAARATAAGFERALKAIRPGINERDAQTALEDGFTAAGGQGTAYGTIVGSGYNATVLHYRDNAAPIHDGDLICIDAAAKVEGYCADVTRTFPANGRFTTRQRELYDLVLEALDAAIGALKPGRFLHHADDAARAVFRKAGVEDKFIHGIGHHLGMEVHDITPDGPLQPGMIVTVEPGLYFPEEKVGIRIEDDVLITAKGTTNLTGPRIPRTAKEIERAMA